MDLQTVGLDANLLIESLQLLTFPLMAPHYVNSDNLFYVSLCHSYQLLTLQRPLIWQLLYAEVVPSPQTSSYDTFPLSFLQLPFLRLLDNLGHCIKWILLIFR